MGVCKTHTFDTPQNPNVPSLGARQGTGGLQIPSGAPSNRQKARQNERVQDTRGKPLEGGPSVLVLPPIEASTPLLSTEKGSPLDETRAENQVILTTQNAATKEPERSIVLLGAEMSSERHEPKQG